MLSRVVSAPSALVLGRQAGPELFETCTSASGLQFVERDTPGIMK
jgi:hypothetical protein